MLTNLINELAQLLIGQTPTLKLSDIPSKIYTDDKAILDISKLVLDNGDEWDFNRKVYLCAYNLEKYTLDLLKRENSLSVAQSIKKLVKTTNGKKFVSFMNGPFFNMSNGIGIGRKKINGVSFDTLFTDYLEPWENNTTPLNMRGFGFKDNKGTFFLESPKDLSPSAFDDAKMYFEGTPLIIDKKNSINNFVENGATELLNSNTLQTSRTVFGKYFERNTMGLPFIGISSSNNINYLISITLEDKITAGLPTLTEVFYTLFLVTKEINIEKLIYTDGSDSLFLKYGTEVKHEMYDSKNKNMPFYFGIRKI
jgi:hypothetical protein